MADGYVSKNGIWRLKAVLQAVDVKGCFTSPVTLLPSPGVNKIIYVNPQSIVIKQSTGTAFDFAAGNIYIGNSSQFAVISATKFNGNSYQQPSFVYGETEGNGGAYFAENADDEALLFGNDTNDCTNGTRTVTISFNYTILNLV